MWRVVISLVTVAAVAAAQGDVGVFFTQPSAVKAEWVARERTVGAGLARLIGEAREEVAFAMLRLDLPEIVEALLGAKGRGVRVRVLTDDDISSYAYHAAYRRLALAGVPVRTDRGQAFNLNVHHKFCVVDRSVVWTGDWNATEADTHRGYHAAFFVRAPGLAADYVREFDRLYKGELAGVGAEVSSGAAHSLPGGGTARVHFGYAEDLSGVLAREILRAHKSVDVAHMELADYRVVQALLVAHQRGVRVRVAALSFRRLPRIREQLARFNVPVSAKPTASKIVIVDGRRVVTGSYNCTLDVDYENLIVLEDAPRIVGPYAEYVEEICRPPTEFFLSRDDPKLPAATRAREAALDTLRARGARGLDLPTRWRGTDRDAAPALTFSRRDPAVVPVRVAWWTKETTAPQAHYVVTFERRAELAPGTRVRFVLSTGLLNDSMGNHLAPGMRPVVLDSACVENLDGPLRLPFRAELPGFGPCRVELDAFILTQGAPARWIASWRLPPRVRVVTRDIRVDAEGDLTSVRNLGVGTAVLAGGAVRSSDCAELRTSDASATFDGLDLDPERVTSIVVRAVSDAARELVLWWRSPKGGFSRTCTVRIPLVTDGRPHAYAVDLGSHPEWRSLARIGSLRVANGDAAAASRLLGVSACVPARLGAAAAGTVKDGEGRATPTLEINGSSGGPSRRVWCASGAPVTVRVRSPRGDANPQPFVLLARIGVPGPDEATSLEALGVPGRVCFRPHLVEPPGLGVSSLADAAGIDRGALLRPGPAPVTFSVPSLARGRGGAYTLQAVFLGPRPAVSNAVVVIVR